MKNKNVAGMVLCCCSLVITFCTPKSVIKPEVAIQEPCPPLSEHAIVDTLAYAITFPDSVYRTEFIGSFRSFLNNYQFTAQRSDSGARQIVIRMLPLPAEGKSSHLLSPLEPEWITETTIEQHEMPGDSVFPGFQDTLISIVDTIIPQTGGKIRLHLQRQGIDETFIELLAADPFTTRDSTTPPPLSVDNPSSRKVNITLNGRIMDGRGKPVSALDLIEAWTNYIRKHPAEGFALFRYVEGVLEFIQGKEAVVRGFGAANQQACYLRLTKPDAYAVERVRTPRLFGIYSRMGSYYPAKTNAQEMVLVANRSTITSQRPFLDTLILNIAEDQNPILSFSLRKYDAITLTSVTDIAYARSALQQQAELQTLSHDRYFITCNMADSAARRYLASRVNAGDLLQNTIKAEGAPITALISDTLHSPTAASANKAVPPTGREFRILFRKDDQVSRRIAEKLLADLSGSGIRSSLVAAEVVEYERALIEQRYECAVGWVHERVRNDLSEQLRLATIYFNDMLSEQERIDGFWELPLFAINRYLLMRKPAGLYHGAVGGIFASANPIETPGNE